MNEASAKFLGVVDTRDFREACSGNRVLSAVVQMHQYLSNRVVLESFRINPTGFAFIIGCQRVEGIVSWESLATDGEPPMKAWVNPPRLEPGLTLTVEQAVSCGDALSSVANTLRSMRSVIPVTLDPKIMDADERGVAMAHASDTWRRIEGALR